MLRINFISTSRKESYRQLLFVMFLLVYSSFIQFSLPVYKTGSCKPELVWSHTLEKVEYMWSTDIAF